MRAVANPSDQEVYCGAPIGFWDRWHGDDNAHVRFVPGRFGRTDNFYLVEGQPLNRQEVAALMCFNEATTRGVLRTLDEAVKTDAMTVFFPHYAIWKRVANKSDRHRGALALPLYERRLQEQQRILAGALKRGHKAFGYYPLDGGT